MDSGKTLATIVMALLLSACTTLRHSVQGYHGPTTGPMARMRFMDTGHDPQVFTARCTDFSAKPAGHVNSFGHARHSIGIPVLRGKRDDDFVEATIRALQPVTIGYLTETTGDLLDEIQTSNMFNSGGDTFTPLPPPKASCRKPILQRTFVPAAGADYEARYVTYRGCPTVEISRVNSLGEAVHLEPIHYLPTRSCDDDEDTP